MCANVRLADLDDLVECFEDFVKKSLILISVAVGAVVVMVIYVLGVISGRSPSTNVPTLALPVGSDPAPCLSQTPSICDITVPKTPSCKQLIRVCNKRVQSDTSDTCPPAMSHAMKTNSVMLQCTNQPTCKTVTTAPVPVQVPPVPSCDEQELRDTKFTGCSHTYNQHPSTCTPRISIPSLAIKNESNRKSTPLRNTASKSLRPKSSCCSTCCHDTE